jgi:hypothetical protein
MSFVSLQIMKYFVMEMSCFTTARNVLAMSFSLSYDCFIVEIKLCREQ